MTTTTFDALAYARKLEKVGFSREQAEAQATALREVLNDNTVTREYLDLRLKELEYKMTIRLGGIVVACTAILLAALPIILK